MDDGTQEGGIMYIGNWSVKKKKEGFFNRVVTVILLFFFFYNLVNLRIGNSILDLVLAGLNGWFGWSFTKWEKIDEYEVKS